MKTIIAAMLLATATIALTDTTPVTAGCRQGWCYRQGEVT